MDHAAARRGPQATRPGSATERLLQGKAEEGYEGPAPPVLGMLARSLEGLVARNEARAQWSAPAGLLAGSGSPFHGATSPDITLEKYLARCWKFAGCSDACFVLAHVYIDRLIELHPQLLITANCVHRLLIASLVLAVKFLDDIYYSNAFLARVGGVSTQELNSLELALLGLLDYRLQVQPELMEAYCAGLEAQLAADEAHKLQHAERQLQQKPSYLAALTTAGARPLAA